MIADALKPGGKHFMDLCNAEYAKLHFPATSWEAGENALSLSSFEWNAEKKIMLYGGKTISYGEPLVKPEIIRDDAIRLYTHDELDEILNARSMVIKQTYSNYYGKPETSKELQLMLYSIKL